MDKEDGYTEDFGKQWQDFNKTQIDSLNSFNISKEFFDEFLFTEYEDLEGKTILEVGSGAGRFTEHLVKKAKTCVSVDMSSAIYHNVSSNKQNLMLVKADFTKLEPKLKFDIVICAAAKVGGILANMQNPSEFLHDNIMINHNEIIINHLQIMIDHLKIMMNHN